ncbi:MAG: hypothetical protein A3F18_02965 [Legionellales bacterium RIFCSPHIGHO2_12_FULL_37_14]|nr:MAG: hypothetical protein A3F18_02965 [Legionellales bacterium RIFCSPHIGHO2_12_FULL_37_14]
MNYSFLSKVFFILLVYSNLAYADLELHPIKGKSLYLSELKGRWVLINFWASWCEPCISEIQEFNRFYKTNGQKMQLFAVNIDEVDPKEQLKLANAFNLSYPSLDADKTRASLGKHIEIVPTTIVFSPDGKLKNIYYGQMNYANLKQILKYRPEVRQSSKNSLSSRD